MSSQANLSKPVFPSKLFLPMLSAIVAITPFAIDAYLPALGVIAQGLQTDMSMMQLSVSLFLTGYAAGLLFFGAMADIFGRRPIMLLGLSGYALCAWGLSFSESISSFLVLRLAQAFIGAAATVPVSGYIKEIYGDNMAKGMSYLSMIMMLAPMVAPTVGIIIMEFGGWQWIFMGLGIYALVMLIFAVLNLPKVARKPMTDTLFNTMFKAYRLVLAEKAVRRYIFIVAFATLSFFGYLTAISFVYLEYYGVSEKMFGLLFGLNVVFFMLGSFINTRLMPRFGSLRMFKGALVIVVISGSVLFCVNFLQMHLYWTVGALAIFLSSIVVLSTNNDALILLNFPEQTGTATGVIGVLRFGFGALAGPILALLHDGTSMAFCYLVVISVTGICVCMMLPRRT